MSKNVPAGSIKKAISYLYLLAFCPPNKLAEFKASTQSMRKNMAEQAGMKEAAFMKNAVPEACRHIVAFQQASREPEKKLVVELTKAAQAAEKNEKNLRAFKEKMNQVVTLPGRAKPENRLHRNKGCSLCTTPCRYGYFTLVSDPQFKVLQDLFKSESERPADEQTPLRPAYAFAIDHINKMTGSEQGVIVFNHVVNMAYCLLLLGMAKSRMALPERQLVIFQGGSQEFVRWLSKQNRGLEER